MDKRDIRDFTREELRAELRDMGQPGFRAGQIFGWLYKKYAAGFGEMSDLGLGLRERLAARFDFRAASAVESLLSGDGARKHLLKLSDGQLVETVWIPSASRATVCLSTQVGCRFGCLICASGRRGFLRNLSAAEILDQVLFARRDSGRAVTHIVFMGMGEPLDNFDALARAIRILNDSRGLNIAARRMTVSTSGFLPGLERLKTLGLQVELAVSLQAATDELRDRLVPLNRRFPLSRLVPAIRDYSRETGRRVTLEYTLVKGWNDSPEEAGRLARLARSVGAKVNLIPCSPVEGEDFAPSPAAVVAAFRRRLEESRVRVTLRQSRGRDIRAACGQLAGRC